jgi:lysophospholipase L1-like esterase
MRLSARQWLAAAAIILGCAWGLPRIWARIERTDRTADYRLPYALSKDYWLYQQRLARIADPAAVLVLGDSVVWGEYVLPSGTLTHFLNHQTGVPERFVNGGLNGLFPLAMEGLIEYYGQALYRRKLIVHCNVLWMSSPKADLSARKKQDFNHSRLVPQFAPLTPPCYQADAAERLGVVAERNVEFFAWVNHLNCAYFGQQSIPRWTLEEDSSDPPRRANAWRDPLAQITLSVPADPGDDPQRGPASPRHKPWNAGGAKPARFSWVALEASLQWKAFRRLIQRLRGRGNDVLVIVGPFNEHMVADAQRPTFRELRAGIAAWLDENRVPHVVPETLPSPLYADASHPLTEGYELLAARISRDPAFRAWLAR